MYDRNYKENSTNLWFICLMICKVVNNMNLLEVKFKYGKDLFPYTNWVKGTCVYRNVPYSFEAKVYPVPSMTCIDNGNISKLRIKNLNNKKDILGYDRGFYIGRKRQCTQGIGKAVIDYLNDFVKTVDWDSVLPWE